MNEIDKPIKWQHGVLVVRPLKFSQANTKEGSVEVIPIYDYNPPIKK